MMDDTDEVADLEDAMARANAFEAVDELEESLRSGGAVARLLISAKRSSEQAAVSLLTIDPMDSNAIRTAQWEVRRFEELVYWIRSVVEQARQAAEDLTDQDVEFLQKLMRGEPEVKDA